MDSLELTGRSRTHILDLTEPRCSLHRGAVEAFVAMRAAAAESGHDLVPVSSFRDFEHQTRIWNAKFRGERPLLGTDGLPLDASSLTDEQKVEAILVWSALPGASRHHWGSEIDVIDRAAMPPDYRPQLVPAEFAPAGHFTALNEWLEAEMGQFGFFRPYRTERGGVHPEPWHLSYAPVSLPATQALTPDVLAEALSAHDVLGKEIVRLRLAEIHARYIANVDAP
jgi:LAS superfamily LD-carboxypeptidase LdcB